MAAIGRKVTSCFALFVFLSVPFNSRLSAFGRQIENASTGDDQKQARRQESTDEFAGGSGIRLSQLTPLQIENLATLARVWGFLKYHDPAVTGGKRSWDVDLFRVMPAVVAAPSRQASNAVLADWIDSLGPIDACTDCVSPDSVSAGARSDTGWIGVRKALQPDIQWIGDTEYLGIPLAHRLEAVYRNRVRNQQYYVGLTKLGNPDFDYELSYATLRFPDSGYQLLGLFRLWNIVEYWDPYRNLVEGDWPGVLAAFIPRVAPPKDKASYARAMTAVIAEINDSHANLRNPFSNRLPVRRCGLPVNVRFIDHRAIVTGYTSETAGKASGLEAGDEVTSLDNVALSKLVTEWTPLYPASNDAARLRDIARNLTSGPCGPVQIGLRRDERPLSLLVARVDSAQAGQSSWTHDLEGPSFQLLSKDIAYLKLSSVVASDLPSQIASAKGTRGLIVDIRNYPSDFVVFALGSLLVDKSTPFVEFTSADLSNPGAFHFQPVLLLNPAKPHYEGKVVILVDEVTQSQAEYTAMALSSAPGAIVVGSTTAGADGNVSSIPLPGGLSTMISGLGIFYPDGTPTQRVGVRIDIEVHPTITGIREHRDEVLESAIHQIDSRLSPAEVELLARPSALSRKKAVDGQSRKPH